MSDFVSDHQILQFCFNITLTNGAIFLYDNAWSYELGCLTTVPICPRAIFMYLGH